MKNSAEVNKSLTQEIEADLKSTQLSAMGGLNSGLGSVEKVDCIKVRFAIVKRGL